MTLIEELDYIVESGFYRVWINPLEFAQLWREASEKLDTGGFSHYLRDLGVIATYREIPIYIWPKCEKMHGEKTCHICVKKCSDEFPCPRCEEMTCEDCFEPFTQFNVGPQDCRKCADNLENEGFSSKKRVAVCVCNTGLEDRFDEGVEYYIMNHPKDGVVWAFDRQNHMVDTLEWRWENCSG